MAKVLIIGSGGAGLSAAIAAKQNADEVFVVTKEFATRSQTSMAQGGINAVLYENDSVDEHIQDTLKGAKGKADEQMVQMLCQNAKDAIEWLESMGMPFSRTKEGKIAQRKLGASTHSRACYAQDYSGLKLLHTLYDYASKLGVVFLHERFLLELLVEENTCFGAVMYNIQTGEIESITADVVVLATGGYSKIYDKHSTNSASATADGLAVAKKAGAKLRNMEFVQFHPTALKSSSILIGEAARGAGGRLYNSEGERFVDELKTRDEVSLAIFKQIQNNKEVFLDITHLGEEFIQKELPQERKLARIYEGIDPVKSLIPIKPAAHFTMGGIAVDNKLQTNITNLFAVGECSEAGVHGANRLGGNALLEIIVFGKKVAECMRGAKKPHVAKEVDLSLYAAYIEKLKSQPNKINFYEKKEQLAELMYEKCGILREHKGLSEMLEFIQTTQKELPQMGIEDKSDVYNTNLVEFLEFCNMLEIAKEVVCSAMENSQSIGAHRRSDV